MRIYLAARYRRREELLKYRWDLESIGHVVPCRWLNGDHQINDRECNSEEAAEKRIRFAKEDWSDLDSCAICISFTEEPRSSNSRGGRHVEFGAALAWGIPCIVVGPRENVFHALPEVQVFPTWAEALTYITNRYIAYRTRPMPQVAP